MPAPSPSPAPVRLTCPQCAAQVPCYDPGASCYFGCPACYAWFGASPSADGAVAPVYLTGFRAQVGLKPAMPLGAVAELGGYRCRVTGYQVRREQGDDPAEWGEYQLRPAAPDDAAEPVDFPVQLVEFEGEWQLVRRAPAAPAQPGTRQFAAPTWPHRTERVFEDWHHYRPVVRFAQGEFDWNILDDEQLYVQEFANVAAGAEPFRLVSEHAPNQPTAWYQAERLNARQVAQAFGINLGVPTSAAGVAGSPPDDADEPLTPGQQRALGQSWLLLGLGLALVLGMQLLAGLLRPAGLVLEGSYPVPEASASGTRQMLVSEPFTLPSPTALEVTLTVDGLSNHWAEVAASLVNEQTGQGYEFSGSLEDYHGTEDGESWNEGNTATVALLHHLPAGRYHVNFYPTVEPNSGPVTLEVRAEQHVPLWSNFWLAAGLLLLLGLLLQDYVRQLYLD